MKIAIIGRTEILYDTAELLHKCGHNIGIIITSKAAPEYTREDKDFKLLAQQLNVPCIITSKISRYMDTIAGIGADVGISVNYTNIIPQNVIDLFPLGILNAHGGDLPRYRGNACQAWAILNGEDKIGLCIHKMIGGELDSGDIITKEYLQIDQDTKITKVMSWVHNKVPGLFIDALSKLEFDQNYYLERQSNEPDHCLRCYPRLPEDGRIIWNQPAINVLRLVNASNKPYSGAYCFYNDNKMIIWDACLVSYQYRICAVPGQVMFVGNGFLDIACASEILRIKYVEYKENITTPDKIIQSIRERLT